MRLRLVDTCTGNTIGFFSMLRLDAVRDSWATSYETRCHHQSTNLTGTLDRFESNRRIRNWDIDKIQLLFLLNGYWHSKIRRRKLQLPTSKKRLKNRDGVFISREGLFYVKQSGNTPPLTNSPSTNSTDSGSSTFNVRAIPQLLKPSDSRTWSFCGCCP